MIGEWVRFGLCAFCVLGGLFAVFTAILGLFRFDFALNRLHASAVADTLGLGLMALGAAIAVGWSAVCWKLALVVVLQWCTSPLSGHMLAQLEYRTDAALPAHLELPQETEEGGVRV